MFKHCGSEEGKSFLTGYLNAIKIGSDGNIDDSEYELPMDPTYGDMIANLESIIAGYGHLKMASTHNPPENDASPPKLVDCNTNGPLEGDAANAEMNLSQSFTVTAIPSTPKLVGCSTNGPPESNAGNEVPLLFEQNGQGTTLTETTRFITQISQSSTKEGSEYATNGLAVDVSSITESFIGQCNAVLGSHRPAGEFSRKIQFFC